MGSEELVQQRGADLDTENCREKRIFVTGATGYVGGRLVPALLDKGYAVRCLARKPEKLSQRPWRGHAAVEVVQGNLTNSKELASQLEGCDVAYYLVHSMVTSGESYAAKDLELATTFSTAASASGLQRIIYLGGLGEMGEGLSRHLRSRRRVEEALATGGVPVTTLRAAMIIGSGSASFEILRYLVERLPIMITPRWVETESQPVAISDVLHWLLASLDVEDTSGRNLEVGGPDVVSYRRLMQLMAEELGLAPRLILGVPVLTPRLSSAWISLITPVTYRIARPLAEGLRNRVVVTNDAAQQLMPHEPLSARAAIREAVTAANAGETSTRWSVAGPIPGDPDWSGGKVFVDSRSKEINANPDDVFEAVCRVGGGHGWYAGDVLWRIRGWMDQLVGGPGLRRGRRHPEKVEYGEALDFWRVVGIERGRSLLLHAEMKLPGIARLEFEMTPREGNTATTLHMNAKFRPRGLLGILYWYAVVPLHSVVFGGMLNGIKRAAESAAQQPGLHQTAG